MEPQTLHINELLLNIEKMVRPLIGEDIELATIAAAAHDTVRADPGQLEQVLLNLVVNARDAMPQGGHLTVESADDYVSPARAAATPELQPGVYVAVSIADTGVGMDARTRDRIFEPFFTTKAPGKGTGLGLATAYGIVRQSGGVIEVDSAPGRGTRMTIRLPFVASQAGVEQPCDTVANARDGHETILLVEDDARVRKLIRDVLTHKGYVVLEAARGNAALRFAERYGKPLHLAILDVVMPEMSGPEVGRNIVRLRPETRLLYISGYIDEAVLQHGILESGLPFLPKPFLPNVLAAKVREVLDAGMNVASA